jgi:anti-sigma-K factor RskA
MHLSDLRERLVAAARSHPPGDHVPYAFEKRVMAHVQAASAADSRDLWARALWRAAAACTALVVLVGVLTFVIPGGGASAGDLSQDFENTMLASLNQDIDSAPSW